ncbi:MAG TPA: hypothetical protein VGX68_22965 [Thermoanaerobaculia bacterium]|jgi:hypothetical protein|nr:hypothetical protein [Thermoanaerobaculia bacterium]
MTSRIAIAAAGLLALAAVPARGTQVKIFQTQSQSAFLAGTMEGVSVDSLGRIQLAPRVDRVASLAEPFLLTAAVHPDGWVVGTGNAGKVLKIDRKGTVTELFAAPEPEVFAVWADADGTVFAGTSPRGKVYRIPKEKGAKGEVFFDPGETYIWALARSSDGGLLVGTGTQGKLFRVDAKGRGEVLYDSDDTHVRAVEPLPGGDVLMGTAGEGLILRVGRDGQARTLYDADEPEVVSLAAAADGTCYAAVISSEASLVDQAKDQSGTAAGAPGGAAKPASGQPQVTVTVEPFDQPPAAPPGGRRAAAAAPSGPRSEVLSISPAGVVESLWSFPDDTVYDLLWQDGRLWVATGLEGKLYRWADQQMILEKDVDERQIVAVLPGEPGPVFATTNAAALFRVTAGTERTGTYTSAALDAEQVARFGTFSWQGEVPPGAQLRFSFRSGVSAEPDRTWSSWTEPRAGSEVPLGGLPNGRYVQWRAELRSGDGASPRIYETELSYRQENLSPKIGLLAALDPGQILVPANFNPTNQVYEPAHPNREGIFTSLTPAADDDTGGGRNKVLWKLGYQTLRWMAADPNDDDLVYDLSFRPANGDKGGWLKMVEDLKDDHFSFDALSLPDGIYRFRLRASDEPSNDPENALEAEQVSDPVVIDHTPPALGKVEKEKDGALRVTVRDAASPLREALYSANAEEWMPVRSADGLLDGRTEILLIPNGKAGNLGLLRVTDAAHNVVTFNLTGER